MHSNEGQPRRKPPAPAPRGGRGGSYVTGSTVTPNAGATHYPTPVAPAAAPAPAAPAPHYAPPVAAPHPTATTAAHAATAHALLSTVPPEARALGAYALEAAKLYGIKNPFSLLGLSGHAMPHPRGLTLRDVSKGHGVMGPVTESAAVLTKTANKPPPPPPKLPPGAPLKYLSEVTVLGKKGASKGRVSQANADFLDPRVAQKAKQFAAKGQTQDIPAALQRGPQTLADLSRIGQRAHPAPKRLPANVQKRASMLLARNTIPAKGQQSLAGAKARKVVRALTAPVAGSKGQAVFASLGLHKKTHPYVNPFLHSKSAIQTRTDQGVDYYGEGAISAIGKAEIVSTGSNWPGGGGVVYKLLTGPKAGRHVFVYEGVNATVQPGDVVQRGQQIATFAPGGSIEMGWASPTGQTAAVAQGQPIAPESSSQGGHFSPAGAHFQDFLHAVGGATPSSILDPSAQGLAEKAQRAGRNPNPAFAGGAQPSLASAQVKRAIAEVIKVSGTTTPGTAEQMLRADIKYGRQYRIPPSVLAAVGKVENGLGGNATSTAGAQGYMQFIPSTRASILQKYGVDAYGGPAEAVHAAALLLKDSGAARDPGAAVANYNPGAGPPGHSWYEDEVMGWARKFGALDRASGAVGSLAGGGAAATIASAAATGAVPLGSSGAVAQALVGAPASVRREFHQSQRHAQAKAQIESRARGFITPPSGATPSSPLPFGFGGDYSTAPASSGSGGAFRPRARTRSSR